MDNIEISIIVHDHKVYYESAPTFERVVYENELKEKIKEQLKDLNIKSITIVYS